MKNLAGTFGIYALYLVATVICYGLDSFNDKDMPVWALIMLGSSLVLFLLWYVLGEFVIRPNASDGTWQATWWLLFIAVGVAAGIVTFVEANGQSQSSDTYPLLHFIGGLGAFYLSSLFFSPFYGRHHVPLSKYIHK